MPISDRSYKKLNLDNVNRAPKKRGVYALYAESALIYLGQAEGKTDTIRARLRGHLGSTPKAATRYKREPSPTPKARLKALLDEYVTAHGRLPKNNVAAK